MNKKPEITNEKETLNLLENLSDEELLNLKNKAVGAEDYLKAYEIKQELERREVLSLKTEKKIYNNEKESKLKALLHELKNNNKNIEISESMEQNFEKICQIFREKAISANKLIDDTSSDEFCYQRWQDLYTFLKNFCSDYSHNFKELDNNKTIKKLWLAESFNNIYRRCLMFSDAYNDWHLSWKSYFFEMYSMFYDLEDTISQSNDSNFFRKWDNRNMPTL